MKLSFGYSISDSWSAEADISLNIKEFIRNKDSTENAHWGELYGYDIFQSNKFRETKTETGISFCYWPDRAFKGSFVGFGASFRDRNGFDLTPRIGYCCKIYKKLNIRLLYNIRIIESIKKEQISAEGIGIEIDYVF